MRPNRLTPTLVALVVLAACGSTPTVHTDRADPIGSVGATPTGPSNTAPGVQGNIDWGPCHDPSAEDPSLECATLTVPLDYDNPRGDTIDMALVRIPASSDRQGAVLFNPGGPGVSGFDFVAMGGQSLAAALGLDSFDLIGFDPRGVDRSGGIRCVSDEFADKHLYVDDTPDTPEEKALAEEAKTGFIDGCVAKYGDTLRFYSTENTARDMDAIRSALGDEQISFLGGSYGTYLGAVYATMFSDRVRAMVLDSAFEPNGDTVEQQFKTQLVGFENAFNNWISWCQQDSTCQFTAADVGARWDALKQRLDDTPIAGPDGRLANNAVLETATNEALYSRSDWPVLARALAQADDGDATGIFALADSYNRRADDGTYATLFQSFPVISCASGLQSAVSDDPEALVATLHAAAPRFGKDITVDDVTEPAQQCSKLVGKADLAALSYAGDGPIVVVGGANDPATPIRWAQKMITELGPNARLVTFTGEGHGQILASSCVTKIEAALLADLKLPKPDTVCEPNPVVAKPDWWDTLPVPDGVSDVAQLPALASALGAEPTQVFSEMRTTSLSPDEAIAAYTQALRSKGFQILDAPQSLPIADTRQGAYVASQTQALLVEAMGPKAFDDEILKGAKGEVPPNTTVVLLIAAKI